MKNINGLTKIRDILDENILLNLDDDDLEYDDEEKKILEDIFMSITRLKEKKEKLKYENEYIKNLIEMTDEGVITVSEENKVIFANNVIFKIFEITDTNIIGEPIRDIAQLKPVIELIERSSESYLKEKEINVNGKKLIISLKIKTMKGNLKDKIVMIRDITEEAKLRDIIFETKKIIALGDLASGIAHEIRNPLTPIKGLLQIIKTNLSGKSQSFDEYMNIIFSEIDKINNKIESLNKFAEKEEMKKDEIYIDDVLSEVVLLFQTQSYFTSKNIQFEYNFNSGGMKLYLNKIKIEEAILNIMRNSCEAIKDTGIVKLNSYVEDKRLIIEIMDNGKGISKKTLKNVINPFYTTKEGEKAMGLGLSITYKIVNEHNGGLFIDSEEGKGTIVKIMFYI